jgi:hypothetical protein
LLWKTESTWKKIHPQTSDLAWVHPLPSAKDKWHIDNALGAKIAASVLQNGKRGFHIQFYGTIST